MDNASLFYEFDTEMPVGHGEKSEEAILYHLYRESEIREITENCCYHVVNK